MQPINYDEIKNGIMKVFITCGSRSECRSCKQEIWWMKSKNGKNIPFCPDGTVHFENCPDTDKFRKPRETTGEPEF